MKESIYKTGNTTVYIGDWQSPSQMSETDLCISVAQDCTSRDDMHLPLHDGHKNKGWKLDFKLNALNQSVWDTYQSDKTDILIHCGAGMSRSPMVAVALMAMKSGNIDAAFTTLEQKLTYKPDIHPKLKEDVTNSVKRLRGI